MNFVRPLSYRTSLRLASLSIAAVVALNSAACHSGPSHGPGGGPQAVHIPIMEASGKFFDNQLSADVRFGRANLPDRPRGSSEGGGAGDAPREGRGPRGSGGGGFSGNASMGPLGVGGGGGGRPGGGGGRGPGGGGRPDSDGGASPVGSRVRTENNPAVQLHLTLSNHGTQPLDIEIFEFSSLLGNFAVHPDKVSIAPGETAAFDPMTSRLGIPQGDLPLKVRLRQGNKIEEQTLTLKIISEDGPSP